MNYFQEDEVRAHQIAIHQYKTIDRNFAAFITNCVKKDKENGGCSRNASNEQQITS